MKKSALIAGFILFSIGTQAQQFFIKGGLGYSMAQAGQSLDGTGTPYNGSVTGGNVYNYKNGASLSSGLNGTVGGGYMFNDHIGVELDLMAGLAPKKYASNINNQVVDSIPSNISSRQYANTFLLLAPQLVVQTGGKIWNIFARGGVVIPLYTHITQEQSLTNLPGSGAIETDLYTYDNKTDFALGITAAIGVQYNLTDNTCLWAELNMLSMSLPLKESDLKSISVDGQGYQLPPGQNNYTYSNHLTYSSGGYTLPSYTLPFSNVGLQVGIMYKFDKSSKVKSNARPSSHHGKGGRDNVF